MAANYSEFGRVGNFESVFNKIIKENWNNIFLGKNAKKKKITLL